MIKFVKVGQTTFPKHWASDGKRKVGDPYALCVPSILAGQLFCSSWAPPNYIALGHPTFGMHALLFVGDTNRRGLGL